MTLLRLAATSYHGDPTRLAATVTDLGIATALSRPGRSRDRGRQAAQLKGRLTVLQNTIFRYTDHSQRRWAGDQGAMDEEIRRAYSLASATIFSTCSSSKRDVGTATASASRVLAIGSGTVTPIPLTSATKPPCEMPYPRARAAWRSCSSASRPVIVLPVNRSRSGPGKSCSMVASGSVASSACPPAVAWDGIT